MNVSNVTKPYYYHYTEPTDDLVTFNVSVTPIVTLTPATYDVLDNREALSTSPHGEQPSVATNPCVAGLVDYCRVSECLPSLKWCPGDALSENSE